MNSLERCMATVRGEPTDRRFVSLTLSLYGAGLTGCALERYYTDSEAYVQGQAAVLEAFAPDVLFSAFALTAEAQAFGMDVQYYEQQAPAQRRPSVDSARAFLDLPLPDISAHPRLLFVRQTIQMLSQRFGREVPVAGFALSPLDLPALVLGLDKWLETLLFDRDMAQSILETTSRFFVAWTNTLFQDGATLVVSPAVFSNPAVITPELLTDTAKPCLQRSFTQVTGPLLLHHGGNPIGEFLSVFKDLPHVIGFGIDHRDDYALARENAGPDKVIMAGLSGPNLDRHSPDHITRAIGKLLESAADDPRMALMTTGADIPLSTPPENILAIRTAVENRACQDG